MRILFSLLFFLFLVLPLVSAQEITTDDITIPFNQLYDVKRQCFNNGTFCSSTATCNLTIINADGHADVANLEMTNQIAFHNRTILVNALGIGTGTMVCEDSGGDLDGKNFDQFRVEVTGDGLKFQVFPYQFFILIIGIFGIGLGKWKEDLGLLQIMGAIIVMIFGVITLFPGYAGINYSNLSGQSLGIASLGIGFWFMIEQSFSLSRQVESFQQDDDGRDLDDGRFHG